MRTLASLAKRTAKLAADNSPAILTAVGVTGTFMTAYLTGKATFKAAEILEDEVGNRDRDFGTEPKPLEFREKFNLTWQLYIPAAGTAIMTVVCIIAANRIGTRRAAGLAAAYSTSQEIFAQYQKKVAEKLGPRKEEIVRAEVAQERVTKNPVGDRQVLVTSGGNVLCYDVFSDRYFLSDMSNLRRSQNEFNVKVINDGFASLNDFYELIGLPTTGYGDEVGWNTDRILDLRIAAIVSDEDEPCLSIEFAVEPHNRYRKFH